MNIFITSTGENTGKSFICAGLAAVMQSLGYEMAVYKPIQTGCKYANNKQFSPDLNFVKRIDPNIKTYSTYNFKQKIIPAVAADSERIKITVDKITRDFNSIKKENDIIIVEGNGGIMTPVTPRLTMADVVMNLKLPTILVINVESNFINNALMTVKSAELHRLEILGVILNNYSPSQKSEFHEEVELFEQMLEYDILGYMKTMSKSKDEVNPDDLISEVIQNINLSRVFNMEIPKLG